MWPTPPVVLQCAHDPDRSIESSRAHVSLRTPSRLARAFDTDPASPAPRFLAPRPFAPIQRRLELPSTDDAEAFGNKIGDKDLSIWSHGETLTNSWGEESNTTNFNATDIEAIDRQKNVYIGKKLLGTLDPLHRKSEGNKAHAKMHLVSSFLHTNANSWPDNYVYGSGGLNGKHEEIEKQAKAVHPKHSNSHALYYCTEVKQRETSQATEGQLATHIASKWRKLKGNERTRFKSALSVGKNSATALRLSDYVEERNAAIARAVTSKVQVIYQPYRFDGQRYVAGEREVEPAEVPKDKTSYRFRNSADYLELRRSIPREAEKRKTAPEGEGTKKVRVEK